MIELWNALESSGAGFAILGFIAGWYLGRNYQGLKMWGKFQEMLIPWNLEVRCGAVRPRLPGIYSDKESK